MSQQILLQAKSFGVAVLASQLLCMSVQAGQSNPVILNLRDSIPGIQLMNHAHPRLQHKITHFFPFFPRDEKVGQLMPGAIAKIGIFSTL